ncbi:hypothetical protein SAMN06295924_1151, partial [Rathayibacter rathayi NCPPB 2980 = VKM Ac-1601]
NLQQSLSTRYPERSAGLGVAHTVSHELPILLYSRGAALLGGADGNAPPFHFRDCEQSEPMRPGRATLLLPQCTEALLLERPSLLRRQSKRLADSREGGTRGSRFIESLLVPPIASRTSDACGRSRGCHRCARIECFPEKRLSGFGDGQMMPLRAANGFFPNRHPPRPEPQLGGDLRDLDPVSPELKIASAEDRVAGLLRHAERSSRGSETLPMLDRTEKQHAIWANRVS